LARHLRPSGVRPLAGGDQQSGNLLYPDDTNFTENGAPQLFRIESGPVRDFPQQLRIARADFDFDMGVGQPVGNYQMIVLGAASRHRRRGAADGQPDLAGQNRR
jgi:hypothetical protein